MSVDVAAGANETEVVVGCGLAERDPTVGTSVDSECEGPR